MCILPLLTLTVSIAGIAIAPVLLAQEQQLPANSTSFTGGVPTLVSADAPYNNVNYLLPQYFFTINLPADTNQSLGQVTIQQQESPYTIEFDLDKTQAFEGTENKQGQALELKEVTQDPKTQTINVSFDPPVPPDTTFTISLAESDNGSLDDLPDDPNQMTIWTCLQENKKIEVEAQDESTWKEITEKSGWECSQQISNQAGGDIQFSCQPEEGTLGILTFTWLEGKGGKEQMQAWMQELADRPDMNCQMATVQPWDTEEDVEQ
jgi:hypothetical protein